MNFSSEQVKLTVKKYISETFLFNNAESLLDETSFLESGIIDSTGILELINYLQSQFNLKINDSEMMPENLDSLDNIAQYVTKKLSAS
jgi:acyl carrier protein